MYNFKNILKRWVKHKHNQNYLNFIFSKKYNNNNLLLFVDNIIIDKDDEFRNQTKTPT